MQRARPIVLSIGGFDPSAGAGVLADIKTFEQINVYGLSVLTANTLQTDISFFSLDWSPVESVVLAVEKLCERFHFDYVKIGVVPDFQYLHQIIKSIKHLNSNVKIIWDPVIRSSSGRQFLNYAGIGEVEDVFSKLFLITPNLEEYEVLLAKCGPQIFQNTKVLLKGGHKIEGLGQDILILDNKRFVLDPQQISSFGKHGSGCVLSSAITAYLAKGIGLLEACKLAKRYTLNFLKSNETLLGYHHE